MAVSNDIKLIVYNDALRLIGERRLQSLSENREAKRLLDEVWNTAVEYCLEEGMWKFSIRSREMSYSPSVELPFGYSYAFEKPEDLIRITGVSSSEFLTTPLLDYRDEGGYWFANLDTIYISYVSNDDAFGLDSSLWPHTFKKFLAAHLAYEIVNDIKKDAAETFYQRIERELTKRMTEARSHDAQAGPTRFAPMGSWVASRGGWGSRRDWGVRSRLTG